VIINGKQWIVDWATGTLTRCEPPDYGEIVGEKGGEVQVERATSVNASRYQLGRVP
jgi:hypothetical protein